MKQSIFIRNDSNVDLTLVEPCRDLFDPITDARIGEFRAEIFDLETDEFLGDPCDQNVTLSPGETVRSNVFVLVSDVDADVTLGEHQFMGVFGAIGENGE